MTVKLIFFDCIYKDLELLLLKSLYQILTVRLSRLISGMHLKSIMIQQYQLYFRQNYLNNKEKLPYFCTKLVSWV